MYAHASRTASPMSLDPRVRTSRCRDAFHVISSGPEVPDRAIAAKSRRRYVITDLHDFLGVERAPRLREPARVPRLFRTITPTVTRRAGAPVLLGR